MLIVCSAAEHAGRSGKKTVMPADVFAAMHECEFDFMLPRLEAEVTKFTSIQADKRNTYRKKVREVKKGIRSDGMEDQVGGGMDVVAGAQEDAGGDDGERAQKRVKMDEEGEGDDEVEEAEEQDGEDEEVEDDEIEEEEEGEGDGLVEDALEEREERDEDDEMADGDESD